MAEVERVQCQSHLVKARATRTSSCRTEGESTAVGRNRQNRIQRQHDKSVPTDLKSRLVGCGNFEDTDGLRADSPTVDVEVHNLVFSWCASHKVRIRSADIKNANFQRKAEPADY